MIMSNNLEVLIKQYLRSILDISVGLWIPDSGFVLGFPDFVDIIVFVLVHVLIFFYFRRSC